MWLKKALALTREYGVTFYDAAYHALALTERGVFLTAIRLRDKDSRRRWRPAPGR